MDFSVQGNRMEMAGLVDVAIREWLHTHGLPIQGKAIQDLIIEIMKIAFRAEVYGRLFEHNRSAELVQIVRAFMEREADQDEHPRKLIAQWFRDGRIELPWASQPPELVDILAYLRMGYEPRNVTDYALTVLPDLELYRRAARGIQQWESWSVGAEPTF